MNKKQRNKGFTLVELMIVVAIMAILAAVSAPRFTNQIQKAKDAKALSLLGTWRSASNIYYTDKEGVFGENFGDLAEFVDASTQKQSFEEKAFTNVLDTGTSSTAIFLEVGESGDKTGGDGSKYFISATYTTDGSITVDTGYSDNARGDAWVSQ